MSGCKFAKTSNTQNQTRSQDFEKGGAFLKEWDNCKQPLPEFALLLNQIQTVYPKLRRISRPKSEIRTVFRPQNRWSPKKKKDFYRNWNEFFGRNRKFKRFFRPNHTDSFSTSAPKFLWEGCFHFLSKNRLQELQKRAILHTFQANGKLEPPAPPHPPWLRYCTEHKKLHSNCQAKFIPVLCKLYNNIKQSSIIIAFQK